MIGSMSSRVEPEVLSPERFRALAHPLRLRILHLLRADGPSTATRLGVILGESSGSTSYHLRQLAAHGFVEPDPREQRGRVRWWRASFLTHKVSETSLLEDPELADVADLYLDEVISAQRTLLRNWLQEKQDWSQEWRSASACSGYYLQLAPDEAREMIRELDQVVERYRTRQTDEVQSAETRQYVVQLFGFPRRTSPTE
jgi:DNA-binding transcriptional ArsR family regulator